MPHPNNKQDKNTNPVISKQDCHLIQPCPSEGKKKKKKTYSFHQSTNKGHTKKKPTQTTGTTLHSKGRNQKEGGIRPESLRKGDIKCNNEKKKERLEKQI